MYPHRINLKGPWDVQPLAPTRLRRDGVSEAVDGPVPPPLKMLLPNRWADAGLPGFQGKVRFRRGFAWPNPLASYERLWLIVGGADYFATAAVNGQQLAEHAGPFEPFEFEITQLAEKRNELLVEVDCPKADPATAKEWLWRGRLGPGGGLWGPVSVEVRRESFLRLTRIETECGTDGDRLHLEGEIVSEFTGPFDLSVRLAGRELCYQPTRPGPFAVTLNAGPMERWRPAGQGQHVLHELLIQLNDLACQLDQRLFHVGFREVKREGETWLVNGPPAAVGEPIAWSQPLAEMTLLETADEAGKLVVLESPVRPEQVQSLERRKAADALLDRLRRAVARHPSLLQVA